MIIGPATMPMPAMATPATTTIQQAYYNKYIATLALQPIKRTELKSMKSNYKSLSGKVTALSRVPDFTASGGIDHPRVTKGSSGPSQKRAIKRYLTRTRYIVITNTPMKIAVYLLLYIAFLLSPHLY